MIPAGLEPSISALKGRKVSSGHLFCDDRSEAETCVLTFRPGDRYQMSKNPTSVLFMH